MLIAAVLENREAQALVQNPDAKLCKPSAATRFLHRFNLDVRDNLPPSKCASV